MNISICITVFNEEQTIAKLLDSLLNQTEKADEIIIVDGGSKDKTIEIIRHYQKKDKLIKLLIGNYSRAKGRNIAVETAKNETIAMTDAGCIADKYWLGRITRPFLYKNVDIVAGFYTMKSDNDFKKAEARYLGVLPSGFSSNFLPSTRSIAFTKEAWEEIGGFPEGKGNSAEDTDFNYKALKSGMRYVRVKNALVEWGTPDTISGFFKKIYNYSKWDVESGILWNPVQKLSSHNIHSLSIFARYFIALTLTLLVIFRQMSFVYLFICIFSYFLWSYRKAGIWGPVFQITSDMAVMLGFLRGMTSSII